ncbi:MAG: GNAT family N-acetyltransferase [Oscillospiraceae bacterium]
MREILITERTFLRPFAPGDYKDVCKIMQDPEVMYAYEHAFEPSEVKEWMEKQFDSYDTSNVGLMAVIDKETDDFLGQAGLTIQKIGDVDVLEIGYLFNKKFWHNGYATEAAIALKDFAFEKLGAEWVYSIIRDTNIPSQKVAERVGMTVEGQIVKNYYNMQMPHLVYSIQKPEIPKAAEEPAEEASDAKK